MALHYPIVPPHRQHLSSLLIRESVNQKATLIPPYRIPRPINSKQKRMPPPTKTIPRHTFMTIMSLFLSLMALSSVEKFSVTKELPTNN